MSPSSSAPASILETERLSLRELSTEDAGFILRLLNEPSFISNIGDRGVRTLEDARSYLLTGPLASYHRHGFGIWRLALKTGDTPIGICGLLQREMLEHADLGYALLPEFWSQGYAGEACAAVMAHARAVLGLPRLLAVVNEDNTRSIRLLEKMGFRCEGKVRLAEDEQEILLFGS